MTLDELYPTTTHLEEGILDDMRKSLNRNKTYLTRVGIPMGTTMGSTWAAIAFGLPTLAVAHLAVGAAAVAIGVNIIIRGGRRREFQRAYSRFLDLIAKREVIMRVMRKNLNKFRIIAGALREVVLQIERGIKRSGNYVLDNIEEFMEADKMSEIKKRIRNAINNTQRMVESVDDDLDILYESILLALKPLAKRASKLLRTIRSRKTLSAIKAVKNEFMMEDDLERILKIIAKDYADGFIDEEEFIEGVEGVMMIYENKVAIKDL